MRLVSFGRRSEDRTRESGSSFADHDSLRATSLGIDSLSLHGPGALRVGAILPAGPREGDTVDLNRALALKLAIDDVGAPEAEADSQLPSDMTRFLRLGERAQLAAARALAFACEMLESYDAPDLVRAGVVLEARAAIHHAPVPHPGKILCVARNYRAHADERGQPHPEEPVLFLKASSALIGPGDEIVLPQASREVDYEGELAVVIGDSAREVDVVRALEHVAGYSAANDVSARDFQNTRGQHFIGKSCDSFAPMGPALVTADEVPDPQALELSTTVSGETRQKAHTSEMIFSVAEIIAFASKLMTLEPGDILLTGTPAGVGAAANPPRWLRDGDVVDVQISGIGRLRNYVRAS